MQQKPTFMAVRAKRASSNYAVYSRPGITILNMPGENHKCPDVLFLWSWGLQRSRLTLSLGSRTHFMVKSHCRLGPNAFQHSMVKTTVSLDWDKQTLLSGLVELDHQIESNLHATLPEG